MNRYKMIQLHLYIKEMNEIIELEEKMAHMGHRYCGHAETKEVVNLEGPMFLEFCKFCGEEIL